MIIIGVSKLLTPCSLGMDYIAHFDFDNVNIMDLANLKADVLAWMLNNIDLENYIWNDKHTIMPTIKFKYEEDAVAFKLRWS